MSDLHKRMQQDMAVSAAAFRQQSTNEYHRYLASKREKESHSTEIAQIKNSSEKQKDELNELNEEICDMTLEINEHVNNIKTMKILAFDGCLTEKFTSDVEDLGKRFSKMFPKYNKLTGPIAHHTVEAVCRRIKLLEEPFFNMAAVYRINTNINPDTILPQYNELQMWIRYNELNDIMNAFESRKYYYRQYK